MFLSAFNVTNYIGIDDHKSIQGTKKIESTSTLSQ